MIIIFFLKRILKSFLLLLLLVLIKFHLLQSIPNVLPNYDTRYKCCKIYFVLLAQKEIKIIICLAITIITTVFSSYLTFIECKIDFFKLLIYTPK